MAIKREDFMKYALDLVSGDDDCTMKEVKHLAHILKQMYNCGIYDAATTVESWARECEPSDTTKMLLNLKETIMRKTHE